MVDRTTKLLLALIVAALSAIYVHLVLSQSAPAAPAPSASSAIFAGGAYTYVVSDGYLSIWNTQNVNGKDQLVMVDSKPLPEAAKQDAP